MQNIVRNIAVIAGLAGIASTAIAQDRVKKLRVAVYPATWSESIERAYAGESFRKAIEVKLTEKLLESGRFIVMERHQMRDMDDEAAIKEANSGQSQQGKTVAADFLIKPEITDFAQKGKKSGIDVGGLLGKVGLGGGTSLFLGEQEVTSKVGMNIRMFNASTSEMVASESGMKEQKKKGQALNISAFGVGYDQSKFDETPFGQTTKAVIDEIVDKIVAKLNGFEWSCKVAKFNDESGEIYLNAGTDQGINIGDELVLYKNNGEIVDPDTGEKMGADVERAGRVKIVRATNRMAVAKLIDGKKPETGWILKDK